MLAQYIREREGFESIITDEGFASYKITGDECYIKDIFTMPDYRGEKVASDIADQITEIAKRYGCTHLLGSVSTTVENPTASTKVLLAYGFKVFSAVQGGIFFRKELK